jgi:hypothetical protein
MTNIKDCLKNFIGLSQVDCNCTAANRPSDYNRSDSGYFLDGTGGVNLKWISGVTDCGTGGLWEILDRAKADGLSSFIEKLTKELIAPARQKHKPISCVVGKYEQAGYLMSLSNSTPIVGVEIKPKQIKGGVFIVKELSISLNTNAAIDVHIYANNNFATPIFTGTTTGNVGTRRILEVNKTLPLTDKFGERITYYVCYERPANALPFDNKLKCGCGSEVLGWDNYSEINGFQALSISDLEQKQSTTWCASEQYSMSLIVKGEFRCNGIDFLCGIDPTSEYGQILAYTLQLLAVKELLDAILKSDRVNFYTLMNPEMMLAMRNENSGKAAANIKWLAQNVPGYLTDCYSCISSGIISKNTIVV